MRLLRGKEIHCGRNTNSPINAMTLLTIYQKSESAVKISTFCVSGPLASFTINTKRFVNCQKCDPGTASHDFDLSQISKVCPSPTKQTADFETYVNLTKETLRRIHVSY